MTPLRPGRKEQEYPIVTSVEQANEKKCSKNNQDMIVLDVCCRGKIGLSVPKKNNNLDSGTQGGRSPLLKCIKQDPNAEEHWYDRHSNHVQSRPNKTNLTPEINSNIYMLRKKKLNQQGRDFADGEPPMMTNPEYTF